jgi:hypothetical protein
MSVTHNTHREEGPRVAGWRVSESQREAGKGAAEALHTRRANVGSEDHRRKLNRVCAAVGNDAASSAEIASALPCLLDARRSKSLLRAPMCRGKRPKDRLTGAYETLRREVCVWSTVRSLQARPQRQLISGGE